MSLSSSSFKEGSQSAFPLSAFSYENASASQKKKIWTRTCSAEFVVIFTCNRVGSILKQSSHLWKAVVLQWGASKSYEVFRNLFSLKHLNVTGQGGFARQRVTGTLLDFGSNDANHRYYRLPTLLKNSNKMGHGDTGQGSHDMTIGHAMVLRLHGIPTKWCWKCTWKTHSITTLRKRARADYQVHTNMQWWRIFKEPLHMGFGSTLGHTNLGDYMCTQVLSPLQSIELVEPGAFPVHSKIGKSELQPVSWVECLSLFPRSLIILKLFLKLFIFPVTHLKSEQSIPVLVTEPQ